MIQVKNVAKRYEGKRTVHALRGVSLNVARGEMVAMMGPSGCGKSTLLNIIGRLDRPSEGSVFQFFNLLPTLTAQENVALPLHLARIRRNETAVRSAELLKTVGLEDRFDHLPDELSGGEQQRVAMARALALQPPVILADEPTGNLDSKTGQEVLLLLKKLQEQFGVTVIMVTHDSVAAGSCGRILSMRDGQLVDGME